jgi:dTDP-4-amino-4,6-dideoxy-D-galactose acyltransferase
MADFEYLEWDSTFFEMKIGKIVFTDTYDHELHNIYDEAKMKKYHLLYIFCAENYFFSEKMVNSYNLKLVDRKIVYSQKLNKNYIAKDELANISEYKTDQMEKSLEELAYASGQFSRFKIDTVFGEKRFRKLYMAWMEKSLRKEIADKVFVKKNNDGKIIGMITLKTKPEYSDIGLIAISEQERGKGYGKELVRKCIEETKAEEIKVTTQLNNKKACKFYERVGFRKENITNIYHLWV